MKKQSSKSSPPKCMFPLFAPANTKFKSLKRLILKLYLICYFKATIKKTINHINNLQSKSSPTPPPPQKKRRDLEEWGWNKKFSFFFSVLQFSALHLEELKFVQVIWNLIFSIVIFINALIHNYYCHERQTFYKASVADLFIV